MSAYRIVQEALTNALRYAPGRSTVGVTVIYGGGTVDVEVRDDGARVNGSRPPRLRATASSACASAPRSSAASWRPARRRGGGFASSVRGSAR